MKRIIITQNRKTKKITVRILNIKDVYFTIKHLYVYTTNNRMYVFNVLENIVIMQDFKNTNLTDAIGCRWVKIK